jgi:hypothetical protein
VSKHRHPRIALGISPRRSTAGRRTCYRFRAVASGRRITGVAITVAGRRVRIGKSRQARLCLTLKAGTHAVRGTRSGYVSAKDRIIVRRAHRR